MFQSVVEGGGIRSRSCPKCADHGPEEPAEPCCHPDMDLSIRPRRGSSAAPAKTRIDHRGPPPPQHALTRIVPAKLPDGAPGSELESTAEGNNPGDPGRPLALSPCNGLPPADFPAMKRKATLPHRFQLAGDRSQGHHRSYPFLAISNEETRLLPERHLFPCHDSWRHGQVLRGVATDGPSPWAPGRSASAPRVRRRFPGVIVATQDGGRGPQAARRESDGSGRYRASSDTPHPPLASGKTSPWWSKLNRRFTFPDYERVIPNWQPTRC